VCHCGNNIAGYLDVAAVTEQARNLPYVVHAEANLYTCSQDSINHISQVVRDLGLNRVVVASCTPLTHQPLFQDSLRAAGLNPYLFEMANIRNQCSWVHSDNRAAATQKAHELVRMAVARARLLKAQYKLEIPVQKAALVVGGGAAGMSAALSLAEQGFPVHLIEKENQLGGNLRYIYTTLNGKRPREILERLQERVLSHQNITLYLNSQVVATRGFKGNFSSVIQVGDGSRREILHGVTILATGGREYCGSEYGHNDIPRVITQQTFERLFNQEPAAFGGDKAVVMIQCVGPGEKFCSRICCTVAIKNALALKARYPDTPVVVLYKDIRTYGFNERLYTDARRKGVVFIRYDDQHRPEVLCQPDGSLEAVLVWEPILMRRLHIGANWLVLSMPVVPNPDSHHISSLFRVPLDADGFFQEAHVKLRPVDFSTDGIFLAGMAHYPKLLDETIIQAHAAAARAARVLSQETLSAGGSVAVVEAEKCTGCLTCIRICPFNVPQIKPNLTGVGNIMGAAYIEPAVCQGCGICAVECPARAIQLMHYTDGQMRAKVEALVKPVYSFISQEEICFACD
jgi:heterodisulfide reductase subunit A-like polyferredoxin